MKKGFSQVTYYISWICDKLFDVGDNKLRDYCHMQEYIEVFPIGVVILILN